MSAKATATVQLTIEVDVDVRAMSSGCKLRDVFRQAAIDAINQLGAVCDQHRIRMVGTPSVQSILARLDNK